MMVIVYIIHSTVIIYLKSKRKNANDRLSTDSNIFSQVKSSHTHIYLVYYTPPPHTPHTINNRLLGKNSHTRQKFKFTQKKRKMTWLDAEMRKIARTLTGQHSVSVDMFEKMKACVLDLKSRNKEGLEDMLQGEVRRFFIFFRRRFRNIHTHFKDK